MPEGRSGVPLGWDDAMKGCCTSSYSRWEALGGAGQRSVCGVWGAGAACVGRRGRGGDPSEGTGCPGRRRGERRRKEGEASSPTPGWPQQLFCWGCRAASPQVRDAPRWARRCAGAQLCPVPGAAWQAGCAAPPSRIPAARGRKRRRLTAPRGGGTAPACRAARLVAPLLFTVDFTPLFSLFCRCRSLPIKVVLAVCPSCPEPLRAGGSSLGVHGHTRRVLAAGKRARESRALSRRAPEGPGSGWGGGTGGTDAWGRQGWWQRRFPVRGNAWAPLLAASPPVNE